MKHIMNNIKEFQEMWQYCVNRMNDSKIPKAYLHYHPHSCCHEFSMVLKSGAARIHADDVSLLVKGLTCVTENFNEELLTN